MSATAGAQFAKCRCRNCDGHIEFDPSHAGGTIECPHCKMETALYVPPPAFKPPAKPQLVTKPAPLPASSPVKKEEAPNTTFLTLVSLAMGLVGCVLVGNGCAGEFGESIREDGSAIRQTVYAVQYGFGFTIICLSACLHAICRLIDKRPFTFW